MTTALNIGYCGGCETKIFDKIGLKTVPNNMYAEIVIVTDKGHIARHGVCKNCALSITEAKAQLIFERIQETWHDEMKLFSTQENIAAMKKLKVSTVDSTESIAMQKHVEKVEKEKKEKLKVKETKK